MANYITQAQLDALQDGQPANAGDVREPLVAIDQAVSNIDTNQLADDAVTQAKIADGAVSTTQLADDAVTQAKIADDSVGSAQLGDNAVASSNIQDGAVVVGKLGTGVVVAGNIQSGAVGANQLADDAVTQAKIADGAVGSDQLTSGLTLDGFTAMETAGSSLGLILRVDTANNSTNSVAFVDFRLNNPEVIKGGIGIVENPLGGAFIINADSDGDEDFETIIGHGEQPVTIVGNLLPSTDDMRTLGTAANRWKEVFATNGMINTSSVETKRDISELSDQRVLDFISALTAIRFRFLPDKRRREVQEYEVGVPATIRQEVQELVRERLGDGTLTLKQVRRLKDIAQFDELPVINEEGEALVDRQGQPIKRRVQRLVTERRQFLRRSEVDNPNESWHYGVTAEDIEAALTAIGENPRQHAMLSYDENDNVQGVSWHHFHAIWLRYAQISQRRIQRLEDSIRYIVQNVEELSAAGLQTFLNQES